MGGLVVVYAENPEKSTRLPSEEAFTLAHPTPSCNVNAILILSNWPRQVRPFLF
jgi:hypothetical protein